jgi:hypothetical protein
MLQSRNNASIDVSRRELDAENIVSGNRIYNKCKPRQVPLNGNEIVRRNIISLPKFKRHTSIGVIRVKTKL